MLFVANEVIQDNTDYTYRSEFERVLPSCFQQLGSDIDEQKIETLMNKWLQKKTFSKEFIDRLGKSLHLEESGSTESQIINTMKLMMNTLAQESSRMATIKKKIESIDRGVLSGNTRSLEQAKENEELYSLIKSYEDLLLKDMKNRVELEQLLQNILYDVIKSNRANHDALRDLQSSRRTYESSRLDRLQGRSGEPSYGGDSRHDRYRDERSSRDSQSMRDERSSLEITTLRGMNVLLGLSPLEKIVIMQEMNALLDLNPLEKIDTIEDHVIEKRALRDLMIADMDTILHPNQKDLSVQKRGEQASLLNKNVVRRKDQRITEKQTTPRIKVMREGIVVTPMTGVHLLIPTMTGEHHLHNLTQQNLTPMIAGEHHLQNLINQPSQRMMMTGERHLHQNKRHPPHQLSMFPKANMMQKTPWKWKQILEQVKLREAKMKRQMQVMIGVSTRQAIKIMTTGTKFGCKYFLIIVTCY